MEEKLKLLTQSAKVIEQLKTQLDSAKNEKSKLVKEKDEALRGKKTIKILSKIENFRKNENFEKVKILKQNRISKIKNFE